MKTHASPYSLLVAAGFAALAFAACDNDDKTKVADAGRVPSSAPTAKMSQSNSAPSPTPTGALRAGESVRTAPAEAPMPPAPPEPIAASSPSAGSASPKTAVPLPPTAPPALPRTMVPPPAAASSWREIGDYTFAQKADMVAQVETMSSQFDAASAALRATSAKPEFADTRFTALAALDDAKLVLSQKKDALHDATAETWLTAESQFHSAWKSAVMAYEKAKGQSN